MAYTLHDTPEVIATIEADLELIVQTLRDADPHLNSVILTGGFARGEGAFLNGRPQNDYDLIAVHELGRPAIPYDVIREQLEDALGMHIDLARVARARLPWVSPTIFWYETTLRGKNIWGENSLRFLRVRQAHRLRRDEGMRLLVNRAAGLLLVDQDDDLAVRIQGAKALLGAMDARLLAKGIFPPSQRERWLAFRRHVDQGHAGAAMLAMQDWFGWAYRMKTSPLTAQSFDPDMVWETAASAVLDAVPVALKHAGHPDLESYTEHDRLIERVHYMRHAREVHGHPFAPHPTGTVRAGTLELLRRRLAGESDPHVFDELVEDTGQDTNELLEALRETTLQ